MQLSKLTVDILRAFAAINTNLVVTPGKKISTVAGTKDIFAEFTGEDEFTKEVAIFNLNEFLGVIGSFSKPELDLSDKSMTIKEGKSKVSYYYADKSVLTVPPAKPITMPTPEVSFNLSEDTLTSLKKMSGIIGAEDLAFIGDGKSVIARVFNRADPTANTFDIDLDVASKETFSAMFKVEKLKLPAGSYDVELSSKRIGKFSHTDIDLKIFIALETTSTF